MTGIEGIELQKHVPLLRDGGTISMSSARPEKNIESEIRSDLNTEHLFVSPLLTP